jgi:hypothetical protein
MGFKRFIGKKTFISIITTSYESKYPQKFSKFDRIAKNLISLLDQQIKINTKIIVMGNYDIEDMSVLE